MNKCLLLVIILNLSLVIWSAGRIDATEPVTVIEEPTPIFEDVPEIVEEPKNTYLGEFKLTAYCPCTKCCGKNDCITASGTKATANKTVAVDPKVIPMGTQVQIGDVTYIAEDVGGAVKGNVIDIYFDSHNEALKFGVQYAEVYKVG